MAQSVFAFTPIERVAVETIAEERREAVEALSGRLAPVMDDLARTSQGRVVNEAQVDDLFLRLHAEFVGRMLAETTPWGKDEDLREPVVELVTRHLLAEAWEGFVRRVVVAKGN